VSAALAGLLAVVTLVSGCALVGRHPSPVGDSASLVSSTDDLGNDPEVEGTGAGSGHVQTARTEPPSSSSDPGTPDTAAGTPSGQATEPSPRALAPGSLAGRVILLDPGHNGANFRHAAQIGEQVDIGNGHKACDTTGTQTDAGYTESAFTLDVALRTAALLRAAGAAVVLTRTDDAGVGPCITERAAAGNRAHADAAISLHADGAAADQYGFHVIVPRGIGSNDAIVAPSRQLGLAVRAAFRAGTGEPLSTYTGTGTGGLVMRDDLGGLNLSTVPKVFIECGNMRNPADAHRMVSPAWRQRAAQALAAGLAEFLGP
jgi:N-acetylmuramoyl-L-alanine amidase